MARVVAKPRHQYQRHGAQNVLQFQEQFVTGHVGQTDVGDDHIVGLTANGPHHRCRFGAIAGCLHDAAVSLKEIMGRSSHLLVGVDYEYLPARDESLALALPQLRVGRTGSHLFAHLLNDLLDIAGVPQDPLQTLHHVGVVADITLHDVDGIVQDVIDGQGHSAVNCFDTFGCRRCFLGNKQFQRVEGRSNIPRKDLEELQIGIGKTTRLRALNVECADHVLVQHEGHCERAFCARAAFQIEQVFGGVVAKVAAACGRNVARDSVICRLCMQNTGFCLRVHPFGQE